MADKQLLHADMDAFFASIEQVENPEYQGKPVIVGGQSGRGVVSAASYEAREYGVHSAMPMWKAKDLCPHAVFLPVNMELYRSYSMQAVEVYLSYTPRVEQVSVDEAYLDITGTQKLFGPPVEVARQIKQRIHERLGVTLSIGIASNRLMAKIASDWEKPDGLTHIPEERAAEFLTDLDVSKLPGIGDATAERLRYMGVSTIGQLRKIPLTLLQKEFGKHGVSLYQAARGQGSDEVCEYGKQPERKQVSEETTLETDSRDLKRLEKILLSVATNLGRRLREKRLMGRTITLKLKYSDFKQITRSFTIEHATADQQEIYQVAAGLLRNLRLGARRVRLVGISVSNLTDGAGAAQLSLFDDTPRQAHRLNRAWDEIVERFGDDAITQARLLGEDESE